MKKLLLSAILALPACAFAQAITTSGTQYTPQQLVTDILLDGAGPTVTNITSSTGSNFGSVNGLGYFTNGGGNFPFGSGVILSTGDISLAPGPNATTQSAGAWPGDSDVTAVMQQVATGTISSSNATKLEFDFIALSDHLSLDYIFASEEYGMYQCTYSDAFVILLTDLETGTSVNIGVIPGTTIPVNVLTVRDSQYNSSCSSSNPAYFGYFYAQGNAATPTNFNGNTVGMSAEATLIPGHNYHLKIAIADRNDSTMDSALFIQNIDFDPLYIVEMGTPNDLQVCDFNNDGTATFDLTSNDIPVLNGLSTNDFTVTYFETDIDAEHNANPIANPASYTNPVSETQTIYVRLASNLVEAFATGSFEIAAIPVPVAGTPAPIVTLDDDTDGMAAIDLTTAEAQILGNLEPSSFNVSYHATLNDAEMGVSDLPEVYTTPSATLFFRLENIDTECYVTGEIEAIVLPEDYTTPPPAGPEEQQFTEGETLADIEIEGENIQWYDNPGQAGPPNTNDTDTPLPLSTPLVNGETYYASQTIYGIESANRLPVTVTSTMGTVNNIFSGLAVFPNPVKDVLHLSNNNEISNVAIYNLMGQLVLGTEMNANEATLNFESLKAGIYVVKVKSGSGEKAVRIIKE